MLLPDHLHAIWTLPANDADFSKRWQLIKRYVTRDCGERLHQVEWMSKSKIKHRESTLWQRRYWEHQIRDEVDYMQHMDYVHYNPVKHGLAAQVKDWPYSSFHRYTKKGVYGENWAMSVSADENGFGEVE